MPDAPSLQLEVVQAGPEATPGTLVAATHRVNIVPASVNSGPDINKIRRPAAGSFATAQSTSSGLVRPWLSYRENATYERMTQIFAMFLKGLASVGGSDIAPTGALADKTWTFLAPDATDQLKRYSYEIGGRDTWAEEEKFAGCVGDELTLTWSKTADVTADVRLLATDNTQAAKTASLALPSGIEPILGQYVRMYIDPSSFGASSYGRFLSGTLRIRQGTVPRYGSDGTNHPNRVALVERRQITFTGRVEYDTTALRAAWRNSTLEKIRLEFPGPVLGGSQYNMRIDIPGTFDAAPRDQDQNVVVLAVAGTAQYDAGLGSDIQVVLVNSLTALP